MLNRWLDQIQEGGKQYAKAVYRRPVMALAGLRRWLPVGTQYIGITGSAGKTTTKDLVHAALATRYRCAKSADSNNQLFSVARTLIATGPRADFCVQELGAGAVGAFDPMLALLRPTVGVVTNVGLDHYSSFRGREGVAAEKGRLIACLPSTGLAVLNLDDDLVAAMAGNCRARVVTYGVTAGAEYRWEPVAAGWPARLAVRIHHGGDAVLVQTRLVGAHQADNVVAAMATAGALGVPLAQAASALSSYEPMLGRMSVQNTRRGVTFIRDDWKAPGWSLDKVWSFMSKARATRKIIVVGTISDATGNRSKRVQRALSGAAAVADVVLYIGSQSGSAAQKVNGSAAGQVLSFATLQAASDWLREHTRSGDLVLLKGCNMTDHLARLALALEGEVNCWQASCGRQLLCDRCRLVSEPAAS